MKYKEIASLMPKETLNSELETTEPKMNLGSARICVGNKRKTTILNYTKLKCIDSHDQRL